jgi:hypothetical protein
VESGQADRLQCHSSSVAGPASQAPHAPQAHTNGAQWVSSLPEERSSSKAASQGADSESFSIAECGKPRLGRSKVLLGRVADLRHHRIQVQVACLSRDSV